MLARHEVDEIGHILLKAADYMETHGYCKFMYQDYMTGHVCALGAIGIGNLDSCSNHKAIDRLSENIPWIKGNYTQHYVDEKHLDPYGKIADWNNAPEQTGPEVIAKFREVAYDPRYAKVTV